MVTVELDAVHVESRLSSGEISCPCCAGGVLGGWGHARSRTIAGAGARLRPRRGRCRSCGATHVLLPVSLLLRRVYLAEVVFAALLAKARGAGHRSIAVQMGVPASTARGWLRVFAGRCAAVREWFTAVAVAVGVDVVMPTASESGWVDALAAIGWATAELTSRFGTVLMLGAVTAAQVAVAVSGGRLLSPGWPPRPGVVRRNTNRP
ncbi:helix-turn-helix domain-containing protein [Rhodococcus aetherivorans]|uniref:helix-turn-helix domain-containing protein n=1 Tax=Rhodococcus aetherivorans TaxID=191292 RepID=UPI0031DBD50D